jgi:hypothetical protein
VSHVAVVILREWIRTDYDCRDGDLKQWNSNAAFFFCCYIWPFNIISNIVIILFWKWFTLYHCILTKLLMGSICYIFLQMSHLRTYSKGKFFGQLFEVIRKQSLLRGQVAEIWNLSGFNVRDSWRSFLQFLACTVLPKFLRYIYGLLSQICWLQHSAGSKLQTEK